MQPRWMQQRASSAQQLGVLPEFGNLWPLYLMAGSIGLWLWGTRSRKT
jgi:hypothetical protein